MLSQRKASLAWRTLRTASSTQLHLFGKIGVNDIEKLMEEMAKPPVGLPSAPTPTTVAANGTTDAAATVKEEDHAASTDVAEGDSTVVSGKRPRTDSTMEVDGPEGDQAKKPKVAA